QLGSARWNAAANTKWGNRQSAVGNRGIDAKSLLPIAHCQLPSFLMHSRDCKIVATMGPASDPPERLLMLLQAGVDCFRLNFSHGAREDHARRMQSIRAAEEKIEIGRAHV